MRQLEVTLCGEGCILCT